MINFHEIPTFEQRSNIRNGMTFQVEKTIGDIIVHGFRPIDHIRWCDDLSQDETALYTRRILARLPNQGPRIIANLLERDKATASQTHGFSQLATYEDRNQISPLVSPIERYIGGIIVNGFDPVPCLNWLQASNQEIKTYFIRRLNKRLPNQTPHIISTLLEIQRPTFPGP